MHKAQNLVEVVLLAGLVVVISIAAISMFNGKNMDLVNLSAIGVKPKSVANAGSGSGTGSDLIPTGQTSIETAGTYSSKGTSNGSTPSPTIGFSGSSSSSSSSSSGSTTSTGSSSSSGGGLSKKIDAETAGVSADVAKNPIDTAGSIAKNVIVKIETGLGIIAKP